MYRALAVMTVLCSSTAFAGSADPWFGKDKALHFGVSALLAGGGYALGALACEEEWAPWVAGAGLALGAGAAKELYDLAGGGSASFRDLAWDAAGMAVGLLTAWAIDKLLFGRDARAERAARLFGPTHPVTAPDLLWERPALRLRLATVADNSAAEATFRKRNLAFWMLPEAVAEARGAVHFACHDDEAFVPRVCTRYEPTRKKAKDEPKPEPK
ncbi:MAG: hypothetical protein ACOX6T_27230 [Myxococcales bacterium]|jgi:uncharacterized protein YfiM (DUF2279 family)